MKRLTAILYLFLLLFNIYGYQLVISCLQGGSEISLEEQIDKKEYNNNELISIKAALTLPYSASSTEYERVYGSIVINGKYYEYVKRRLYQDTLELLCLPNVTKTKLQDVSNELTQTAAEAQNPLNKKNTTVVKLTLPDFFQQVKSFSTIAAVAVKHDYFSFNTHIYLTLYTERQERPPQSIQYHLS